MTGRAAAQRTDGAPAAVPAAAVSRRRNGRATAGLGVLDDHLGYFLRRAQIAVFQDFIRTLSPIEISPAQYSVLVVVGANEAMSQADVAELLGIERARLVRLLHRLEKRGLLQRAASQADRRTHALRLTAAGQALLKRAKALAAIHEARLRQKLGPARHRGMIEALREFDLSR